MASKIGEVNLQAPVKTGFSKLQKIGFFLGFLCLIVCFIPAPEGLTPQAMKLFGILLMMIVWWVTEPVALGITSLLPAIIAPLIGLVGSGTDATTNISLIPAYGGKVFLEMIGIFTFSAAMIRAGLHKRIALVILDAMNGKPRRVLAGFIAATTILSMFLNNTVATAMMIPFALALIKTLELDSTSGYAKALILSLPFSASIGGMATLIGSGTNFMGASLIEELQGPTITFMDWLSVGLPFTLIISPIVWLLLSTMFRLKDYQAENREFFKKELKELGPMTRMQKILIVVLFAAMALFVFLDKLKDLFPWLMLDTYLLCFLMGAVLFLIPIDLKNGKFICDVSIFKEVSWNTLMMILGADAIGGAISKAGISAWIASKLDFMSAWSPLAVVIFIAFVVAVLTEFMTNSVVALAFIPIVYALAPMIGVSEMMLSFVVMLSASFAFCLPAGTAPNALAFSCESLHIKDMIKAGFILKIIGIVLLPIILFLISSNLTAMW